MIKAVIFDWGGVMAPNVEGGWVKIYASILGLDSDRALKIWKQAYPGLNTGQITEDDFWFKTHELYGKILPKNAPDIWRRGLADQPWHEMLEYARELRARGLVTAVLSNTVAAMYRGSDIEKYYKEFNPVILSHIVGMSKPSAEIFLYTLRVLNLQASECIFVDDLSKNVDATKLLGFNAVQAASKPVATIKLIESALQSK